MKPLLIVGAGPVGMTTASELVRYGVPVRIIDEATERTDLSKALVLWSRTLELLDRGGGSAAFVDVGFKALAFNFISGDKMIGHGRSRVRRLAARVRRARSAVRHGLGAPFAGETNKSDWMLVDVHMTGYPLPDSEASGLEVGAVVRDRGFNRLSHEPVERPRSRGGSSRTGRAGRTRCRPSGCGVRALPLFALFATKTDSTTA